VYIYSFSSFVKKSKSRSNIHKYFNLWQNLNMNFLQEIEVSLMKYGRTKSGTIHLFTDKDECLCDLNIKIETEVSHEYATLKAIHACSTCQSHLSIDSPFRLRW
jgi:hypothetical protein